MHTVLSALRHVLKREKVQEIKKNGKIILTDASCLHHQRKVPADDRIKEGLCF